MDRELIEESDQFRFLRAAYLTVILDNLKVSVGLILVKASVMRVSIPLDLSTRTFIPLPHVCSFLRFTVFNVYHSFSMGMSV